MPRVFGLGVLATGLVCPCHVLVGVAAFVAGAPLLAPHVQDGLHALYMPAAVLLGAVLLRRKNTSPPDGERP